MSAPSDPPDRSVVGPCAISRECGGCALIDEPYDEQLRRKTERVRRALGARPELDGVVVSSCVAAPEILAYRNRAKLAVARAHGVTRIGLYRRSSNLIVDLATCAVTDPSLRHGVDGVRRWLGEHRLAFPDGPVFYVDFRAQSGGRCHLTLVVGEAGFDHATLPLATLAAVCPEIDGVAVNFGDRTSSYPLGPITRIVAGSETFDAVVPDEQGAEITFSVPVGGFFQVSTGLFPDIHRRMREHVGIGGPLYDLYCGVGVHGLMVERASSAADSGVVGIEESEPASAAARINAKRLGVPGTFIAGRVEAVLARELESRAARRFVLNPARSGCRREALDSISGVDGARIAYLSCHPETLARDLALLVAGGGLRVTEVLPLDLMPQTDHVETLALIA